MHTKIFTGLSTGTVLVSILATTGVANAASISFSDVVNRQFTNYTEQLNFSKFDSSLGTLTGVTFAIEGGVFGSVDYESRDASASNVTANLAALLELTGGPTGQLLVEVTPLASVLESVTAFDGVIDFGGTSGNSLGNLTASASENASYSEQALLDFFTGTGTIDLSLSAQAQSEVTGPGNIISALTTEAEASVVVTYIYEENNPQTVPEPTSVLGLGLMGSLGLLGLKKKNRTKV